ncbi:MAG TPA: hypothetical protein VN943_20110 [Candidatus Acidoferrum sp.]|nr:hypothetical protein [Candidatus Acidoferrum sp.]
MRPRLVLEAMDTASKKFLEKFGALLAAACLFGASQSFAWAKERDLPSAGLIMEFSASYEDALQALRQIVEDQTIHGTYMFDREKTLTGAATADSTPLFERWDGAGKVFYKVRTEVIAPRHFRESADLGTIAVRYVLTRVSPERTRLRIDAVFVEKAHRVAHPSDGTVESSEYKAIQKLLQAMQLAEQEAADVERHRESIALAQQSLLRQREDESTRLATAQSSVQDLERRVDALRHEVERRVKAPGASLQAAPFRSAAKLADLAAYTEVMVVIVTPHWLGVETPQGQRGWLSLEQLESLP